MHIGEGSEQQ